MHIPFWIVVKVEFMVHKNNFNKSKKQKWLSLQPENINLILLNYFKIVYIFFNKKMGQNNQFPRLNQ